MWGITNPLPANQVNPQSIYTDVLTGQPTASPTASNGASNGTAVQTFNEVFVGDSISPRISVGIGVNWNSPFGPFRLDFARVLKKVDGDDPKTFTFNVGTQF